MRRRMMMQSFGGGGVNLFDNAVAYYKLDETTGLAIDSINGYDGNLINSPSRGVPGIIGNCYEFFAINSKINIPDQNDFSFVDANGDTACTIRTWVNWNSFKSGSSFNGDWLVSKRTSASFPNLREWQLFWFNGDLAFNLLGQNGETLSGIYNNSNLNTNEWYHIVGTYDGSETKEGISIYINGVHVTNERKGDNSLYTGMANTNTLVCIGADGQNWSGRDFTLNGKIDETVIIKNESWTPIQVAEDYNNGNGTTL